MANARTHSRRFSVFGLSLLSPTAGKETEAVSTLKKELSQPNIGKRFQQNISATAQQPEAVGATKIRLERLAPNNKQAECKFAQMFTGVLWRCKS